MSSMYLSALKLSIFGQSHGPCVGAVLDGLPAGEAVDLDALHAFLRRRAPGQSELTSARKEEDLPQLLSGLSQGVTCGAPLAIVLPNADAQPGDYDSLRDAPRPGHADFTAHVKFKGFEDAAGGGHFSGRLTAALCAAGGICLQILARRGIAVGAHLLRVGEVADVPFDPVCLTRETLLAPGNSAFPTLDGQVAERMRQTIHAAKQAQDSVGAEVECAALGVPAGLGDPLFDGMENRIARIAYAIPGVKGVEFGGGFALSRMRGSEANDPFLCQDGAVRTRTNRAGGILGGITTGMPLLYRAAVKPTPTIGRPQQSVSLRTGEPVTLCAHGRHDPCIALRAVPCFEAALALALLDAMLERCSAPLGGIVHEP